VARPSRLAASRDLTLTMTLQRHELGWYGERYAMPQRPASIPMNVGNAAFPAETERIGYRDETAIVLPRLARSEASPA
jgi:hypothetical protein